MKNDTTKMTWEELLEMREKMNAQKEEIEAALSVLSTEFLERLKEEKVSGKIVGNWSISKSTRYSFDTTLEQAIPMGASKMVIDSVALKKLVLSGIEVPGTKKTEYVMVREVMKKEE